MTLRKTLFWLHLAAGSIAGIVILIMSVTGVLLAFERQITAWADREYRSTPSGARMGMEALLANSAVEHTSSITLRADPTAPVELDVGRDRTVFVDAYTGAVLGEGSRGVRNFFRVVEDWHRWIGVSGESRATGRAITGACNLAFLFIVFSGPFLWWPRKWNWRNVKAVLLFRGGLNGRARDFNWHNVAGIWCAVPLFVIVLTGVVMSYPWANNLLYRAAGSEPPAQNQNGRAPANRGPAKLRFSDAAWARAEEQVPGWKSITLRAPLTFSIDQGQGGRPDQRAQLTLDPRTGEVARWEPFSSQNRGRQLRSWFRFIHTGEAGGVIGQSVAGIATAGAVLLVYTGLALALRRFLSFCARKRAAAKIEVCSSPASFVSTTSEALPTRSSSIPMSSSSDSDSERISSARAAEKST